MSNTENKFLFKGIQQVTKKTFESLKTDKNIEKGVLYFVRDTDSEDEKSEIYFGNRKYADVGSIEMGDIKNSTF